MLLFGLFIIWPMLYSLRISFNDWNVVHPEKSINVGFQNYTDVLTDPIFHRAVVNTLVYVVITVPGQIFFRTIGVATKQGLMSVSDQPST